MPEARVGKRIGGGPVLGLPAAACSPPPHLHLWGPQVTGVAGSALAGRRSDSTGGTALECEARRTCRAGQSASRGAKAGEATTGMRQL